MTTIKIEDVHKDGLTKDSEYIHHNGIYDYEFTINMTPSVSSSCNHTMPVIVLKYDNGNARKHNINKCKQFVNFSDMYERKFTRSFSIIFAFLHIFPQEFKMYINNVENRSLPNNFDELIYYLREITLDSQITYKFKLTNKHKSSCGSYISEVYEMRIINPNIVSKIMNEYHLEKLVVKCDEAFTCDICYNENIMDDYKYMPLCCKSFGRSICQECAHRSLDKMKATCPFCRRDFVYK